MTRPESTHPVTLFTGQWADLPLEEVAEFKDTRVRPADGRSGVLGSHLPWGDPRRRWDFVSVGHGDVPWEDSFRALRSAGYDDSTRHLIEHPRLGRCGSGTASPASTWSIAARRSAPSAGRPPFGRVLSNAPR
jgi:hypothetical protein